MSSFSISPDVIIENNIKIAKFLGWTYVSAEDNWEKSRIRHESWNDLNGLGHRSLSFHSSWDWIMSVVDHIEQMGYNFSSRFNHDTNEGAVHFSFFAERDESGGYPQKPYGKKIVMAKGSGNGVYSSSHSKLESIYLAILGFIDYQSEQKISLN